MKLTCGIIARHRTRAVRSTCYRIRGTIARCPTPPTVCARETLRSALLHDLAITARGHIIIDTARVSPLRCVCGGRSSVRRGIRSGVRRRCTRARACRCSLRELTDVPRCSRAVVTARRIAPPAAICAAPMIHPPSIRAAPAPWVIAPVPRSTVAHAQCITKSKGASWSPPTVACPGRCALQSVLAPTGRSLIHPAGVAENRPTSVGSGVTQVIIARHARRRHAGCCETRSIGNDSVVCIAIHIASRESKGHRVGR